MTVLTNMACQVTAAGLSRPSYADILETLQFKFKGIYGTDAYIDPDSQDGQMLAVVAKAVDDCNASCQATYAAYSPATAQGAALSNGVKLNGISRAIPTNSTVTLSLTGTVGTQINNGVVSDTGGNRWLLPATVTLGSDGKATVTGTAEVAGAVNAAAGTITKIETPTLGWSVVGNLAPAQPGAPIESDAALRQRQTVSVAIPSRTVLDGIQAAVLALPGVTQAKAYENDTNVTDANGITANKISLVVVGGADADIANAILLKKTPGCGTFGTTTVAVSDPQGIGPYNINFYRPTSKRIIIAVSIKAGTGYTTTVGDAIKDALVAHVNALGIGKKVDWGRLFVPALSQDTSKYEVDAITAALFGGTLAAADVAIGFNEIANLATGDITLTVT